MATVNGLDQARAFVEQRRAKRHAEGKLLDFEALDKIADLDTKDPYAFMAEARQIVGATGREVA